MEFKLFIFVFGKVLFYRRFIQGMRKPHINEMRKMQND